MADRDGWPERLRDQALQTLKHARSVPGNDAAVNLLLGQRSSARETDERVESFLGRCAEVLTAAAESLRDVIPVQALDSPPGLLFELPGQHFSSLSLHRLGPLVVCLLIMDSGGRQHVYGLWQAQSDVLFQLQLSSSAPAIRPSPWWMRLWARLPGVSVETSYEWTACGPVVVPPGMGPCERVASGSDEDALNHLRLSIEECVTRVAMAKAACDAVYGQ
jgi:hypothetical protein